MLTHQEKLELKKALVEFIALHAPAIAKQVLASTTPVHSVDARIDRSQVNIIIRPVNSLTELINIKISEVR